MDKVHRMWVKGSNGDDGIYIYVHRDDLDLFTNDERYNADDEECIVLHGDELSDEQKVMLKMMEIIRRRSLQEIKKSEADEHGYRTLDVIKKRDCFLIKKATPYSTNMDIKVVARLIKQDLEEHYHGIFNNIKYYWGDIEHFLLFHEVTDFNRREREYLEEKKEKGYFKEEVFLDYFDSKNIELGSPLIEDVEKIHANIGAGYYEVLYKATGII